LRQPRAYHLRQLFKNFARVHTELTKHVLERWREDPSKLAKLRSHLSSKQEKRYAECHHNHEPGKCKRPLLGGWDTARDQVGERSQDHCNDNCAEGEEQHMGKPPHHGREYAERYDDKDAPDKGRISGSRISQIR
jgi:hypothetical protein